MAQRVPHEEALREYVWANVDFGATDARQNIKVGDPRGGAGFHKYGYLSPAGWRGLMERLYDFWAAHKCAPTTFEYSFHWKRTAPQLFRLDIEKKYREDEQPLDVEAVIRAVLDAMAKAFTKTSRTSNAHRLLSVWENASLSTEKFSLHGTFVFVVVQKTSEFLRLRDFLVANLDPTIAALIDLNINTTTFQLRGPLVDKFEQAPLPAGAPTDYVTWRPVGRPTRLEPYPLWRIDGRIITDLTRLGKSIHPTGANVRELWIEILTQLAGPFVDAVTPTHRLRVSFRDIQSREFIRCERDRQQLALEIQVRDAAMLQANLLRDRERALAEFGLPDMEDRPIRVRLNEGPVYTLDALALKLVEVFNGDAPPYKRTTDLVNGNIAFVANSGRYYIKCLMSEGRKDGHQAPALMRQKDIKAMKIIFRNPDLSVNCNGARNPYADDEQEAVEGEEGDARRGEGGGGVRKRRISFIEYWDEQYSPLSRTLYTEVCFHPGRYLLDRVNLTSRWQNRLPDNVLNSFAGLACDAYDFSDLVPFMPGMRAGTYFPPPLREILFWVWFVLCGRNRRMYEDFLDTLALMLQCPEERSNLCWIFHSLAGGGKGAFFNPFVEKVIGVHAMIYTDPDTVLGRFNARSTNMILLMGNELKIPRHNLPAFLQAVTEPTRPAERKFEDNYDALNFSNNIIGTNIDQAVPLARDDRRGRLPDMDVPPLSLDRDSKLKQQVYAGMHKAAGGDGMRQLACYLRFGRDIDDFVKRRRYQRGPLTQKMLQNQMYAMRYNDPVGMLCFNWLNTGINARFSLANEETLDPEAIRDRRNTFELKHRKEADLPGWYRRFESQKELHAFACKVVHAVANEPLHLFMDALSRMLPGCVHSRDPANTDPVDAVGNVARVGGPIYLSDFAQCRAAYEQGHAGFHWEEHTFAAQVSENATGPVITSGSDQAIFENAVFLTRFTRCRAAFPAPWLQHSVGEDRLFEVGLAQIPTEIESVLAARGGRYQIPPAPFPPPLPFPLPASPEMEEALSDVDNWLVQQGLLPPNHDPDTSSSDGDSTHYSPFEEHSYDSDRGRHGATGGVAVFPPGQHPDDYEDEMYRRGQLDAQEFLAGRDAEPAVPMEF